MTYQQISLKTRGNLQLFISLISWVLIYCRWILQHVPSRKVIIIVVYNRCKVFFIHILHIIVHLIQVAAAGVAEDEDAEDEDDEQWPRGHCSLNCWQSQDFSTIQHRNPCPKLSGKRFESNETKYSGNRGFVCHCTLLEALPCKTSIAMGFTSNAPHGICQRQTQCSRTHSSVEKNLLDPGR